MAPFVQGILLGLTFSVLLGPAFFSLIQTSIHRGFKSGAFLAFGIFLSDLTALILCYFGAYQLLGSDPRDNKYISIAGGIILIIFGTYTFSRKQLQQTDDNNIGAGNGASPFYIYIIKGFFLNLLNPGTWFLWITIVLSMSANFGLNSHAIFVFLVGALTTIFATDLLKCFISNQIKRFVNSQVMTWMNRLVGIVLIGFGTYLIINTFIDMDRLLYLYKNLVR